MWARSYLRKVSRCTIWLALALSLIQASLADLAVVCSSSLAVLVCLICRHERKADSLCSTSAVVYNAESSGSGDLSIRERCRVRAHTLSVAN